MNNTIGLPDSMPYWVMSLQILSQTMRLQHLSQKTSASSAWASDKALQNTPFIHIQFKCRQYDLFYLYSIDCER